jgi:hypothetical protein
MIFGQRPFGDRNPSQKKYGDFSYLFYGIGFIAVDNFYVSWFMALGL